ncbi:MAG: alpha-2-macroglobulin family protein [Pseudomonadota bacterium]
MKVFGKMAAVFLVTSILAATPAQAIDATSRPAAETLNLLRITPDGTDVPPGRQVVFTFDRPVVPVGRMDRSAEEIPITITPALNCQWRWLNTSALACELDDKDGLRPATEYRVAVAAGLAADDGAVMTKTVAHRFITQRPKVTRTRFKEWRAPGWPRIQVTFDQPVSRDSVRSRMAFKMAKTGGSAALTAEPDKDDRETPLFFPLPGEKLALTGAASSPQRVDDQKAKVNGDEARRIWVLAPASELPLDSSISLSVTPGLVSALGPMTGVERRTVVEFNTYPEFRFLGVRCQDARTHQTTLITPEFSSAEPFTSQDMARCAPLDSVALVFSAPVINEAVKSHVTITPDLAGGRTDYDPWENRYSYSHLSAPHRDDATYTVWLPERLKAYQRYTLQSDAALFQDEFGRVLKAPVDMAFMTAHRDPALVLDHNKAVLEKQIDSDVPVYVTNLEKLTVPHRVLTAKGLSGDAQSTRNLPDIEDVAFAVPLGIREMTGGASGVVTGHLDSDPRPPGYRPGDYRFFAEITPFQVNVKLGHFNSLVWVTDLATGAPVAGAGVSVFLDDYTPDPTPSALAGCRTDDSGVCTLPGIETLDPKLSYLRYAYDDDAPRLVVRVDKDQDLALVYLDYHFITWVGGVDAETRVKNGHMRAWGTTAQGVYKVGDTIQYKLYVRNHDNRRWVAPAPSGYTLSIIGPKGQTVQKVEDLTLSSFGAWAGEFALPAQAAVGWYQFQLEYAGLPDALPVMRVLVSDFTPSPFRVTTELSGDRFELGDVIDITSLARMHAGGPFANADTRVTVRLVQRVFQPKTAPAKDFRFDSGEYRNRPTWDLHESSAEGNDAGEVTTQVTLADKAIVYGRLTVESAVRDDRGKYVAAAAGADYIGRDRFVGLRGTRWAYDEDAPADIEYLAVDVDGNPVAGLPVTIRVERRETKASRVKGAGNAYLTNYVTSWVAAENWKGVSAGQPATYTFTPAHAGEYRITAAVEDTRNRRHETTIHAWVVGKGRVVWEGPDSNALRVIPDKDKYQVGDTARFLVQNPLPGAMALVAVERYGVLKHWVQPLEGSTPVIDVAIEEDFLPGFYLSVLVTSPRVDAPPGEGSVDLGKPTFRLGYVPVRVTDAVKEIAVAVSTDLETYKPGDTVHARIKALPRSGAPGEPVELAVVVIDEAVFDLNSQGRSYYDPYEGFNSLDGLDLNNYTLLSLLVGRQQFEKKGASPGGGGAAGGGPHLRSLFKYVTYWNPSLIADQDGAAAFSFTVPDNLTGWRIFAMAVTPGDRMGLGDTGFKVNRPTELRPVMPNQVTEGDRFSAGFSVMNRTDRERTLSVRISSKGEPDTVAAAMDKTAQIHLAPFKRETVWLPVETKGFGDIRFTVSAGDAMDTDAVAHTVPVRKRRSLVTAATYGSTLEAAATDRIAFPEGIYPDVGGISVVTSPSVIGNIDGAFRYLRNYRYDCWEQQLTKGVMAAHYQNLKAYMPADFSWPDSATLPQAVLDAAAGFQAPGGGMVYWVPEDAHVSPYLSAYTALAFNWIGNSGYRVPVPVEEKLHGYLATLLRREVMPSFYTRGMASSVRAVALAALAGHGKVSLEDLNRYRPHLGEMDLFGKAHFLMAAMAVDGGRAIADEAARLILSHGSQSGGKVQFNEVLDDSYSYILATPLRSNAAILAALLKVSVDPGGRALVGDIPFKLVRAITQARGNRDHWQNTQENIFCLNALTAFARIFETEVPDMTVSAFLGDRKLGEARFTDLRDAAVTFTDSMHRASPGLKSEVTLKKQGAGRLYYATRMQYAPTEEASVRINAGIDIRREYAAQRSGRWELLKSPMAIRRGELVRVTLYVSLPTLRHFVVVDDPVPGGLEPVNRDLATASAVDAEKGNFTAAKDSWWFTYSDWSYYGRFGYSFYHQELRHAAARFYADYLPAGNYVLSYTAQAIASGRFSVMPVHAEEMYDPEVFGKGLPATLVVD